MTTLLNRYREQLAEAGMKYSLNDKRLTDLVDMEIRVRRAKSEEERKFEAQFAGKTSFADRRLEEMARVATDLEAEMAQFWVQPLTAGTTAGTSTGVAYTAATALTDVSPGATAAAFTFPAGWLNAPGIYIRVTASGFMTVTAAPTLLLGVYYGGIAGTALAATAATTTGTQSTAPWFLTYLGRIATLGATGTILGQGQVIGIAATPTTVTFMPAAPASVTIDTTTAKALTIGAAWGTNNASTLTCNQFMVEQLW